MFFVLDENKNLKEALDKEGVYAALEKAIADGNLESIDSKSAFVSKFKCCVTGGTFKLAVTTQAKFNELATANKIESDTIYYIEDDTTLDDIEEMLDEHETYINDIANGVNAVPKAEQANQAESIKYGEQYKVFDEIKRELINQIYPVGSIYISANGTHPADALGIGEWELLPEYCTLWNAADTSELSQTLPEQLPNIKGNAIFRNMVNNNLIRSADGALGVYENTYTQDVQSAIDEHINGREYTNTLVFSASLHNSTYTDNGIVRPKSFCVAMWKRVM